jgi:hypothetical protein
MSGIGHVIGGTVGKLAVTGFDAIVHALFAPIAHFINTQLLAWLVAVPDYAAPGSHVAATEQTLLAMAGVALGAVATISIARYWAAGVAGAGGSALEGLARTVGAALLLPVWPLDLSHGGGAFERCEHRLSGIRRRDQDQRAPAATTLPRVGSGLTSPARKPRRCGFRMDDFDHTNTYFRVNQVAAEARLGGSRDCSAYLESCRRCRQDARGRLRARLLAAGSHR